MMSESNFNCSETLLTLVARGTAIVTEINRLVELIPRPFIQGGRHQFDSERRYTLDDIVCDFSYFKNAEEFELRIEANDRLKALDEEFCDQYSDLLQRFYLTFEAVFRYASELNRFIDDVEDEFYVGQTLDSLLVDKENLQLLCEAYYTLGLMLLTVDSNFAGDLRERLIVAHYRYSSYKSSPESSIDKTCNLFRSTGFKAQHQHNYKPRLVKKSSNQTDSECRNHQPANYPESYFARARVSQSVVNMLIAKLQSMDIYNQTTVIFPHPEHRSNALAQQASMLVVLLYFCPHILKTQRSRMREIADKFFHNNWVISVGMGELVNLLDAWEPYRAARDAMLQIIDIESVQTLANQFQVRFTRTAKLMSTYIQEGWLDETKFIEQHSKILNCIREANVVLKWMLMHSKLCSHWLNSKLSKTTHSIVVSNHPNTLIMCDFLQDLANLERRSSQLCEQILASRAQRLQEHKQQALDILDELVAIYGQERTMRWVKVNANSSLSQTLAQFRLSFCELNLNTGEDSNSSTRSALIKLINGIESAREAYSDEKSLQVVQLFNELRAHLLTVMRFIGFGEDLRSVLHTVSDFSYAWRLMDERFTQQLQSLIKENPLRIMTIEAVFLKLASAYETQLLRLQQVGAQADLISVTQYYSTKLVGYIREVLHIIPATILELVGQLIGLQANNELGDMPSKITLDQLRDLRLQDQRQQMLELTFKISHYAKGIMLMQSTSIGLQRIDCKQLLEDGVRRELVLKLTETIQSTLKFAPVRQQLQRQFSSTSSSAGSTSELVNGPLVQQAQSLLQKLNQLATLMSSYRRSFEYIQDYVFVYGLRMWQEELSRVVKFHVEQASYALLEDGGKTWASSSPSSLAERADQDNRSVNGHQQQQLISSNFQSRYQSSKAPIPVLDPADPLQSSFVVRILQELLQVTSPRETIYDEQTGAWFDQRSQHLQVIDWRVFESICSGLSVAGLNGVDQMCCSLLALEMQRLHRSMQELCSSGDWTRDLKTAQNTKTTGGLSEALELLRAELERACQESSSQAPARDSAASYARHLKSTLSKLAPASERLLNQLARLGQLQALRLGISCVLSSKCRYEARHLYACLETLDGTLLRTLSRPLRGASTASATSKGREQQRSQQQLQDERTVSTHKLNNIDDSHFVFELVNHLEWIGLHRPMEKIYTLDLVQSVNSGAESRQQQQQNLAALLFLLLLGQSSKFVFSRSISGFLPTTLQQAQRANLGATSGNLDAAPLFYGVATLLNHYNAMLGTSGKKSNSIAADLLELMSRHAKLSLAATAADKQLALDSANLILSIIELVRLMGATTNSQESQLMANNLLPQSVLDTFQFTVCHLGA